MRVYLMEWSLVFNQGHELESLDCLVRMRCVLSRVPLISLIRDNLGTAVAARPRT
ncbi:hypothetical protein Syun_000917 [Stephania yunnanensis]|uniref:Uncharacterized protein n=1 Tax=Stephania yunnanensis TaxID=152371 RepID=A0AAP0LCR1_9MAGN